MFPLALLDIRDPPSKRTAVCSDEFEAERLPRTLPAEAAVILREPGRNIR
ncbi:MAG: hypothetical protein HFG04_01870 [Oscillibacter sp.]|nr:hypothetical protein [Oscillibacter sp.]